MVNERSSIGSMQKERNREDQRERIPNGCNNDVYIRAEDEIGKRELLKKRGEIRKKMYIAS